MGKKCLSVLSFLALAALLLSACGGTQALSPTPTEVPPTPEPPTAVPTPELAVEEVLPKIKWLASANQFGSTSVQMELGGKIIYLDPVVLEDVDSLPKADIILITHEHNDHYFIPDINALLKDDTVIIVPDNPAVSFSLQEPVVLKPEASTTVGDIEVEGVPAYNDNHPRDSNGLGYVISYKDMRIYCSGDTGLTPEMEALTDIDIAIMNLNIAYVLSGEAIVQFAETVKPQVIIPIHWVLDNEESIGQVDIIRENVPETTRLVILEQQ
jgi:L-ascorbate metabolism protein UlaG (beta-lactamase superfamily)